MCLELACEDRRHVTKSLALEVQVFAQSHKNCDPLETVPVRRGLTSFHQQKVLVQNPDLLAQSKHFVWLDIQVLLDCLVLSVIHHVKFKCCHRVSINNTCSNITIDSIDPTLVD